MSSSLTNLLSWQDLAQLSRVSPRHRQIYSFLLESFEKTLLRERNSAWQKKFDVLPELELITPANMRQGLMNGSTSETWSRSGCETTYAAPGSQWDMVTFDPAPLHG